MRSTEHQNLVPPLAAAFLFVAFGVAAPTLAEEDIRWLSQGSDGESGVVAEGIRLTVEDVLSHGEMKIPPRATVWVDSPDELSIRVDRLVLRDGSTLRLNPEHREWRVEVRRAEFGRGARIEAVGAAPVWAGRDGAAGLRGDRCGRGGPGSPGVAGASGGDGIFLDLDLGIAVLADLVIDASGGPGAPGGQGGPGGPGGLGSLSRNCAGGSGGDGAVGGPGGDGGDGGQINLVWREVGDYAPYVVRSQYLGPGDVVLPPGLRLVARGGGAGIGGAGGDGRPRRRKAMQFHRDVPAGRILGVGGFPGRSRLSRSGGFRPGDAGVAEDRRTRDSLSRTCPGER